MAGDAAYGAKRMVDVAVASEDEMVKWKEVFLNASVKYRDICSATAYLALAPEHKRKECFDLLGFSPGIGAFSKWASVNGLDPFSRHMSWTRNSARRYMHGTGEFFVMAPGVIEGFRCAHLCRFFDMEERVGPVTMIGLTLPEERVDEVLDTHLVKEEECVVKMEDEVVEPVSVVSVHEEPALAATYLSVMVPEVREKALMVHDFGPSLAEIASSDFPMQEVSVLKDLHLKVDPKPDVRIVGEDVLLTDRFDLNVTLTRRKGEIGTVTFLQALQWMAAHDKKIRQVCFERDGVDYCAIGGVHPGLFDRNRVKSIVFSEYISDTAVRTAHKPTPEFVSRFREHACARHGWHMALVYDVRGDLIDIMGTESGFGAYLVLANGRHVNWTCECAHRPRSTVRSVVVVRYVGVDVDKVLDGVWYGWKIGDGDGAVCVGLNSAMSVSELPFLPTLGLKSCKKLEIKTLPRGLPSVGYDESVYVEFEFDRNWFANGKSYLDGDGTYVDLDGCVCGIVHE